MKREVAVMRRIADREGERLRRECRCLTQALEAQRKRYPTAKRLAGEVEGLRSAHAAFLAQLEAMNWERVLGELGRQIEEMLREEESSETVVMRWESERGGFRPETTGPAWWRGDGWRVDVAKWVEARLEVDEGAKRHGEGVTYPIIFTHQVRANHRAVARAVGWGATWVCLRRRLADGDGPAVRLCHPDGELVVDGDGDDERERPGAAVFGYDDRGELLRRIEQFDEVDADAHWIRWMERRRRGRREYRVMRESGGTRLGIELDRQLRRLRLVERPESQVVRKRRHVFAEPQAARIDDRYVASGDELDAALEEEVARRIDEGYRIVRVDVEGRFDADTRPL